MADANIRAVITAKDEASHTLSNFAKNAEGSFLKMGAAIGAVSGIVQSVATRAFDALGDSISTAVKRVDTLDNAARTFENMGFKAEDTTKSMKALKDSILGLPTPLDAAVRNMTLLASSTNDIGKSQKLFTALNDGIIGFGGTTEQVNTAVVQLSQAFAGGRVMAQDWNSMLNAGLGPALNAIARQMKITQRDLKDGLSDGSISVEKFQNALIKLDEEGGGGLKSLQKIAKDSTKGIGTGIENMKTAVARGIASILKSIGTEDISRAIGLIGSTFENNTKYVVSFINTLKGLIPILREVGLQIYGVYQRVADYLGPKLEALYGTIQNRLVPSLLRLWHEVIEPILPVLGTALVLAIGLVVDALNLLLAVMTPVITWMLDHKVDVLGFATAFGILAVAMNFNAIVAAFNGAINTAIMTMEVMRLVTIPNALASLGQFAAGFGPVGIAAVAAAAVIIDAGNRTKAAWDDASRAISGASKSDDAVISRLKDLKANGTPAQKAQASKALAGLAAGGSFATGGFTGMGNANDVAGIVHKGEYVLPKSAVDQSTGTPKTMGGSNINVTFQGIFTGSEMEFRKLAVKMFNAYDDAKGMGTL